jgi:hypothetical protein|nr:MAG TPA: hypothetical protein [Caudoviricetes sp.]
MKTWQLVLIGVILLAFTWFWDALFVGDLFRYIEECILGFLGLN